MNITFLIGNGFDLNLGLDTSYKSFIKEYTKDIDNTEDDGSALYYFKKNISRNKELWSSAEEAIGQITAKFKSDEKNADDFSNCHSNFCQELAEYLANQMGANVKSEYKVNTLENPFYGVYTGQYAIPVKPDTIKYLTNDTIDNCVVPYYDTGMPEVREMYNMEKAVSKDPYEMFLSGVAPLITIENPNATTDKELVMFRDSFGSSLAPLLAEGYKKITVVDVRYIQSSFVGNFVDFENADVLFIYSTALLNNSTAMK